MRILVVPLIVQIGTTTFDPTAADACIPGGATPLAAFLASPLLNSVAFDGGSGVGHAALIDGTDGGVTTFLDAFRRAGNGGSCSAAPPTTPCSSSPSRRRGRSRRRRCRASAAGLSSASRCASLGVLRTAAFQAYITGAVIPGIPQITPQSFVLFLVKDVVTTTSAQLNCFAYCEIGYHGAVGSSPQTFSVAEYDTTSGFWNSPGITNVSIVAHELGEWFDDPLVTNPTPAWGGLGQVSGCQSNWENGNSLTGTDFPPITMANGLAYDPQELIFHDWYFNAPGGGTYGAGGKYWMNGSFSGPSKACPPGGTY